MTLTGITRQNQSGTARAQDVDKRTLFLLKIVRVAGSAFGDAIALHQIERQMFKRAGIGASGKGKNALMIPAQRGAAEK